MQCRAKRPPPDLFDEEPPPIELSQSQKTQLITLLEVMLAEIVTAIAREEIGDDQDHA